MSNIGNVRSLERKIYNSHTGWVTRKARDKKLTENPDGYYTVKLSRDGKDSRAPVHRLVAEAFIGPCPEPGMEINHKDYNRKNNCVDNLEWLTHLDNVRKSSAVGHYAGRSGEKNPNYGNHVLHERYQADKELSRQMMGRPGAQNGMARPVRAINSDTGETHDFSYMSECAAYLIKTGLL